MFRIAFGFLVVVMACACGGEGTGGVDAQGADEGMSGLPDTGSELEINGGEDAWIEPEVIYYELPVFDPGNYLDNLPKPDPGQDPATEDPGHPDDPGKVDDVGPVASFCLSWNDCPLAQVCNFSLGRCEQRDDVPASPLSVFGFHPLEASAGDILIIDGRRFYYSLLGDLSVKVRIGDKNISPNTYGLMPDENRVLLFVPPGASGTITVWGEGGQQTQAALPLKAAPTGVLPCDGSTPTGTGEAAASVSAVGPFAAGFVDLQTEEARLFYPALCGSLRRPPVPGQYPLVILLHGNGAGWAGHEYLGQFLATWGFVSLMPKSFNQQYEVAPAETTWLIDRIEMVRGKDLGTVSPVLTGVSTGAKVAMLGHSRGTARLGHVTDTSAAIAADTVASVFQGPVDDGFKVPGMFMVLGATGDKQAVAMGINMTYGGQPAPKWKIWIQGGNHGGFTDHKVWSGFLDAAPTVTRHQQHQIVTNFVLPLFQRAFGLEEKFPQMLDSPPDSPLFTVDKEL